jgi:outer membrane protein assembly factor BamB
MIHVLVAALFFTQASVDRPPASGHWPQWRGVDRENRSRETGLLQSWPEGGPPLLWTTSEMGDGVPPVSVAGGRIYALGFRDGKEYLTVFDGAGAVVWSMPVGAQAGEFSGMRFLAQRPVTIDDQRLYVCAANGRILCLQAADGKLIWEKDELKDFGGRAASFFFEDAPLVDDKLLILKPGGPKGTLLALYKLTGAPVWRTTDFRDSAGHAPVIVAEIAGVRQYIVLTHEHLTGVAAADGKVLWQAPWTGRTANPTTPVYHDGIVFVSCGFGVGCGGFRITAADGKFKAESIYSGRQMDNHRGGILRVTDHLYGTDDNFLKCIDLKTGEIAWQDRCVKKGSLIAVDGNLVVLGEGGQVALVEATPKEFREKGRFSFERANREPVLHPVVVGGRLYIRDYTVLRCYNLRGPGYEEPAPVWKTPTPNPALAATKPPAVVGKGPDAAYVPTPHDVVEKMIEAAHLGKDDMVYDLGSGDGRIVLAAARIHGCKSVGIENDPRLVAESRAKIREANLDSLATIEEKDLFTIDLSRATVVMLYLGAPNNARLLPQLRKLKPGSRIVSHAHLLGEQGPVPDRTIRMTCKEDQTEHAIYVWTTPLSEGKEK